MSFHGLGLPSCSGKDSTVKEQLLLACSRIEGRRASVTGPVLVHFVQSFLMQNSVGNKIQVVFKEIPFPWTEKSDSSFLFCC